MIPKLPATYSETLYLYARIWPGDKEPILSFCTWKRTTGDSFLVKEIKVEVDLSDLASVNVVQATIEAIRAGIQSVRAEAEVACQEKEGEIAKLLSLTYDDGVPF